MTRLEALRQMEQTVVQLPGRKVIYARYDEVQMTRLRWWQFWRLWRTA